MKLIAKNDIIFGAQKFKAGETIDLDKNAASLFMALGWCDKVEEVEKPKTKKKK